MSGLTVDEMAGRMAAEWLVTAITHYPEEPDRRSNYYLALFTYWRRHWSLGDYPDDYWLTREHRLVLDLIAGVIRTWDPSGALARFGHLSYSEQQAAERN